LHKRARATPTALRRPLDNTPGRWQSLLVLMSKLDKLRALFRSYGSCLVAYSGGVDSVFLARVAREVLGEKAVAAIADSPSLPRRELQEALELAAQMGLSVRLVRTTEFDNPSYVANPIDRCYFCKHDMFEELAPLARAEGLAVIVYGENASDVGDFRPGAKAAAEFEVRAPLKEAGLTKQDIRDLSAQLGLPTADKPQMACLSSRIPYGEPVTLEKLKMIEEAEYVLRDLGFRDVRVRHHELALKFNLQGPSPASGNEQTPPAGTEPETIIHLARIEVAPEEMARFLTDGVPLKVAEALRKLGYAHVTLDLLGYRRGSVNESISTRPASGNTAK
jgi:pyridinium-3,5-biscarboxylic acid mononucleotide sulfurtransferase